MSTITRTAPASLAMRTSTVASEPRAQAATLVFLATSASQDEKTYRIDFTATGTTAEIRCNALLGLQLTPGTAPNCTYAYPAAPRAYLFQSTRSWRVAFAPRQPVHTHRPERTPTAANAHANQYRDEHANADGHKHACKHTHEYPNSDRVTADEYTHEYPDRYSNQRPRKLRHPRRLSRRPTPRRTHLRRRPPARRHRPTRRRRPPRPFRTSPVQGPAL